MKLLIVQNYNPINKSGIPIANMRVAKEFVNLGIDVTIASPTGVSKILQNKVKVSKIDSKTKLKDLIANAEIVIPITNFSSQNKPLTIAVIELCQSMNKVCIPYLRTTIKNSQFNEMFEVSDLTQSLYIQQLVNAFSNSTVKKILCISDSAKRSLTDLGLSEEKLAVVKNGIEEKNPIFVAQNNESKKKFDVVFVGRMSREKGIPYLIAALKLVTAELPNLKAVVIGDGEDMGRVKGLIKTFGIEDNVEIMSTIENGEVLEVIKDSKVLVSSSLTESFGIAILESMAIGTPVVVPNIEGPKELVMSGQLGEMFDLGNTQEMKEKIMKILCNNKETLAKVPKAKKYVLENLTSKQQASKICKVIAEVAV